MAPAPVSLTWRSIASISGAARSPASSNASMRAAPPSHRHGKNNTSSSKPLSTAANACARAPRNTSNGSAANSSTRPAIGNSTNSSMPRVDQPPSPVNGRHSHANIAAHSTAGTALRRSRRRGHGTTGGTGEATVVDTGAV